MPSRARIHPTVGEGRGPGFLMCAPRFGLPINGGQVAAPTTRRAGALAAIALYTAVFPANVQMAWDWRHESAFKRVVAFGRLPLQLPMIRRAWRIYKTSSRR